MAYVIVLTFMALLAAIGYSRLSADTTDRGVRLVLAVPATETAGEMYRPVIAAFERDNPSVTVELRPIAGSMYYQKLLVMIASGLAPDLMWMGQSFPEFAHRNAFLDVSAFLAHDQLAEQIHPEALSWYRFGNRQFGAPYLLDMKFIVYNRQAFREAGVAYPTADWTFEDFLAIAKQLTRDRSGNGLIDQYGFRGRLEEALFNAFVVAPDGSEALCHLPEMIDFLTTNLALHDVHRIAPAQSQVWQEDESTVVAMFRSGRAAMISMYTWNLPQLHQIDDLDWAIALNPKVRRRAHWASSQSILISSATKHPELAWDLCRRFLGGAFQRDSATYAIPANLAIAEEVYQADEWARHDMALLINAADSLVPSPRVPRFTQMNHVFSNACESVWNGRLSPQDAMQRARRDINLIIERDQRLP